MTKALNGQIALVTGATRGAGRAIAVELARAGAFVYATGRTTRAQRSPVNRPETIEETQALIEEEGGKCLAVQVDHSQPEAVAGLIERIDRENDGRLDVLINDAWGGDSLVDVGKRFWEHDLQKGLSILENGIKTHMITSHFAAPLMVKRKNGAIIEVTDGITERYRESYFYDLVKHSMLRLAFSQAQELREHNVASLAVTPGYLRSEAMLEYFGVGEENWRDGLPIDPNFVSSETPYYLARAVAALVADPEIMQRSGKAYATWHLYKEYGFTDLDGSQPDWGRYARDELSMDFG